MKLLPHSLTLIGLLALADGGTLWAGEPPVRGSVPPPPPTAPPVAPVGGAAQEPSRLHILRPDDVVLVKVYQEDDLTTQARVAQDGSITMPLLGAVRIGSNTVEHAVGLITQKLGQDYLVNPQVSLTIVEYGKRRFTVLGQVNQPGTYEMTSEEPLNILQAIATAGGYTRIGNPRKIIVQRLLGDEKKIFKLNAESVAEDKNSKPFIVLPDNTISVGEKWI